LNLSVFLGTRYTKTKYRTVQQEWVDERNWGGLADISVQKTWETVSLELGYNQDLYYSAQGDPIDRKRAYFSINRKITDRLNGGLSGGVVRSKSTGEFSRLDALYFPLSFSMTYRITENHFLSLGYSYAFNDNKLIPDDSTADRNRIWVTLSLGFPRKW
jgi:hypothetical protein